MINTESIKKYASVSDKDFFTSDAFRQMLEGFMFAALPSHVASQVTLNISYDIKMGSPTASTNGNVIEINTGHKFILNCIGREQKMLCILGFLFHECAHIRFYNFKVYGNILRKYDATKKMISFNAKSNNLVEKEIAELFANSGFNSLLSFICDLDNVIIDNHDERCMCAESGGLVTQGIKFVLLSMFSLSSSFEEITSSEGKDIDMFFALFFQYVRYGKYIVHDEKKLQGNPHVECIERIKPLIKKAINEDDTAKRFPIYEKILCKVWEHIKNSIRKEQTDKLDDLSCPHSQNNSSQTQQNGSSGGESQSQQQDSSDDKSSQTQQKGSSGGESSKSQQKGSSGGESPKSHQQISSGDEPSSTVDDLGPLKESELKELQKAVQKACKNTTHADNKGENATNAMTNKSIPHIQVQNATSASNSDSQPISVECLLDFLDNCTDDTKDQLNQTLSSMISQVEKEVSSLIIAEGIDSLALASMRTTIVNTVNQNSNHSGLKFIINKPEVTQAMRKRYDRLIVTHSPFINSLVKEARLKLKRLKTHYTQNNYFGDELDEDSLHRRDGKIFLDTPIAKKPDDMVIGLLIDGSGSMENQRILSATEAALVVYEFAKKLKIPVFAAKHNSLMNQSSARRKKPLGTHLHILSTPDSHVDSDKYRIVDTSCYSANRDGMAIEGMASVLNERKERLKLLIVISDGQPSDRHYGGIKAKEDIQRILRKYNKIQVVATAIGKDKESIKQIYGEGRYIDIDNLSNFHKDLIRIIMKKIF